MRKIPILGTIYRLEEKKIESDEKLSECDGYCDPYAKRIVIAKIAGGVDTTDNIAGYIQKVIRHEIAHAFFAESGLEEYFRDEVLVDWIAKQAPKMMEAFRIAKAIDGE